MKLTPARDVHSAPLAALGLVGGYSSAGHAGAWPSVLVVSASSSAGARRALVDSRPVR